MLAPQICNRCRKQRIKCDLRLPQCNNCHNADAECMFHDEALMEDIPCSYLYSLQKRQKDLQRELNVVTNGAATADNASALGFFDFDKQDFLIRVGDEESASSSWPMFAYLGSGSLARLLQHLLRSALAWHLTHGAIIPPRLVPSEDKPLLSSLDPRLEDLPALLLPVPSDQRKPRPELHTLLPRAVQRAIIDHYSRTVAPTFQFLPRGQVASLVQLENPLKWSSSNRDAPQAWALSIIFAVSTSLLSRDHASTAMATIATRCAEDLNKLSQIPISTTEPIDTTRWTCRAMCAVALCSLIDATPDRLWESLGRAVSAIESLRGRYKIENTEIDEPFWRLELTMLKLECFTSLYLCRPSYFCEMYLKIGVENVPTSHYPHDGKAFLTSLYNVTTQVNSIPRLSATSLEDFIPNPYRLDSTRVMDHKTISPETATLYMALHPLFTTLNLNPTAASSSSLLSGVNEVSPSSSQMLKSIAMSACALIDHFTLLNDEGQVLSLWLTAGRTLEAGALWVFYLVRRRITLDTGQDGGSLTASEAVSPLLKVSALLASFAARWSPGVAYANSWQALVDLLWGMLG
ncbi:hypothetical protein PV10_00353 [Exophiala mesophila]|uniref:Zn(2)-C6 fungal-type domain-containing protein n=1 Tax=Exophiala mesophila TaxID=212818 RepID=A0A0D1Y716_EXOME|nr:uncharacterized protein PV10_00353 [Exophiala mesophila]KIV96491.1 hypothetical protein PV10_00353 [Exophiala mesophila]